HGREDSLVATRHTLRHEWRLLGPYQPARLPPSEPQVERFTQDVCSSAVRVDHVANPNDREIWTRQQVLERVADQQVSLLTLRLQPILDARIAQEDVQQRHVRYDADEEPGRLARDHPLEVREERSPVCVANEQIVLGAIDFPCLEQGRLRIVLYLEELCVDVDEPLA